MTTHKKAHFIGICGAGMSAVAKLLADYGWQVSGSDENFYPPVSEYIKKHNISFKKGYGSENIPNDVDLIIIGKHDRLTEKDNEEVHAAFSSGVPVRSFPEVLGDISRGWDNIVVAGSYGKSTCAALLAWCLKQAGKDPSYFIGAIPNTPADSSKKGSGNLFVLEGDEYPSSNWDDSSKFLHYNPRHLLLTSLAHDHLNVFKTPDDYKAPFIKLLSLLPQDGLVVACADGEGVRETISKCGLEKQTVLYSAKGNTRFWRGTCAKPSLRWRIANLKVGEISSFDVFRDHKFVVSARTSLLGIHNIENILGAGTLLLSLGLITTGQFAEAIFSFRAINRRLDRKSYKTSVPFYEGFGSSYAKARAAIEAVKAHFPDKKLFVLFEPHSFSWRSREALVWYDTVFEGTHSVLIYKPRTFSANINTGSEPAVAEKVRGKPLDESGLTLDAIVRRIGEAGHSAKGFDNIQEGTTLLEKNIDKDSVVLALSSGGFVPISPKQSLDVKSRILDLSAPTSDVGGQIGNGFIDLTIKWLEGNYKK